MIIQQFFFLHCVSLNKVNTGIVSDDVLKILIPSTVAVSLFMLGLIAAYLKGNAERRRETRNLKNVITTWIPNLKKPIESLANSCNDLSSRLGKSKEISSEQFKFNHLHVSKISGIELTQTLKTFITNTTGDKELKNSNTYNLVSSLEFFDKIENEIKNKYDEHYQYTGKLLNDWNISFIKFDNLNQIVHKKKDDISKERQDLEGGLAEISNSWHIEINRYPRNVEITFERLIRPYESLLTEYFNINGTREQEVMNLMSSTQDLKIVYQQWQVSHAAYSEIFKGYSNRLNSAYVLLLSASDYFRTQTKIKWFCN